VKNVSSPFADKEKEKPAQVAEAFDVDGGTQRHENISRKTSQLKSGEDKWFLLRNFDTSHAFRGEEKYNIADSLCA
jgi:phage regulator Rha-like protein